MVAGRSLKELISATRRTAKNIRRSLDEIAQELINPRQLQPQPAYLRSPIHGANNKNPFSSRSFQRGYGTIFGQQSIRYASTYVRPHHIGKQQVFKQIWSLSSFKQLSTIGGQTIAKGTFPSTLYANFVKTNSRVSSQYTNFTQQCVRNLNASMRAAMTQSKEELGRKRRYGLGYSQRYVDEVYQMARTNSSFGEETQGNVFCFVDFKLAGTRPLSIPSMSFIDDELLVDLKTDLQYQESELREVYEQVSLINENYGSLPISVEGNGSTLRVHFTNCDAELAESLLRNIGVTKGTVHEVHEYAPAPTVVSAAAEGESEIIDLESDVLSTSTEEEMRQLELSSYVMSGTGSVEEWDKQSELLSDEFYFPREARVYQ